MGGWEDGIGGPGGGVRGAPMPSPPYQTTDRMHSFLLLVSPFPLLFFPSLSLPLSQAGSQVEILNGSKKGGARKEDQWCTLPERSSRAPGLSMRWGQKETSHSLPPSLAPGCTDAAGGWAVAVSTLAGV